jgi:peptide/nickel transport system permease protein
MSQAGTIAEVEGTRGSGDGETIVGRSSWGLFWRRFRRDRAAIAGAILVVELVLLAVLAPLIAKLVGHGPNALFNSGPDSMITPDLGLPKGPNAHFWFGVDQVGRDLFVRVIYGARTSLTVAVVGTLLANVIGIVMGLVGGYYGGWIDTLVSRVIDIFLSLPILLFAIGLSTVCSVTAKGCFGGLLKPGLSLVIGVIALFTWAYLARIIRGQIISLKGREFVDAARTMGASDRRILFSELLPNLVTPIVVYTTLAIPSNILFEAALSFIGVGIPPSTPSWGRTLTDATDGSLFTYAWWMMLFPGLFLVLTTLAFNLVGDGLNDALDPRAEQ